MTKFLNFFDVALHYKYSIGIGATALLITTDLLGNKRRAKKYLDVKLDGETLPGFASELPSITPPLQELIDEVKTRLNLPKYKKQSLRYHVTAFPKPKLLGYYTPYSEIDVFLPDYLNITETGHLNAKKIANLVKLMNYDAEKLDQEDWMTPDGVALINSFLLSRKAKKYIISQQSYARYNYEYFYRYIIFLLSTIATLALISFIKETRQTFTPGRAFVLFILLIPLYASFKLIANQSDVMCELSGVAQSVSANRLSWKELRQIKNGSMIDEEMLDGAIEYLTKLVQRNKATYRLFASSLSFFSNMSGSDNMGLFTLEVPPKDILAVLQDAKDVLRPQESGKKDQTK